MTVKVDELREQIARQLFEHTVRHWQWEKSTSLHPIFLDHASVLLQLPVLRELIENASRADAAMRSFAIAQDAAAEWAATIDRVRELADRWEGRAERHLADGLTDSAAISAAVADQIRHALGSD